MKCHIWQLVTMELPTSNGQLIDTRRKIIKKFYLHLLVLICSFAMLVKFNYYCLLIFVILIIISRFVHVNVFLSSSLIFIILSYMATLIQQIFIFNIYNSFSHDSFKKIAYCTEVMVQYICVATSTVINEL